MTPSDFPAADVQSAPSAAGNTTWTIRLPLVKPLSLNDRRHHMAQYREKKAIRDAVCLLARSQRIPPHQRIAVGLLWVPKDRRVRDPHNATLTLKPAVDGLVDARVVPGDDAAHVVTSEPVIAEPDGDPRIVLVVHGLVAA